MSGRLGGALWKLLAVSPLVLIIASSIFLPGIMSALAAPEIQLSPQSGPPGTNLKVKGSGFTPLSPITLTFDGGTMQTHPRIITTNQDGKFDASFNVPFSIADGAYLVVAKEISVLHYSANATFQVKANNEPPVAVSQSLTITENNQLSVNLTGSDPEGDEITFSIVDQPQHGTIEQFDSAAGTLVYTPDNDYTGPDNFTFKVNDGKHNSDPAEVSITIAAANQAPKMENQNVEVDEDAQIQILLEATDEDSPSLTYVILAEPDHGSLSEIDQVEEKSAFVTYTPNADYFGSDSFTVKASDNEFESEIATVSINILPVQDKPIAESVQTSIVQGQTLAISLAGMDVDGDSLTFIIASYPAHGTLSGSAPSLTYVAPNDYYGLDGFSFKVNDGTADSDIAQVEITIQAAPSGDGGSGSGGGGSSSNSDSGAPAEPGAQPSAPAPTEEPVVPPPVQTTPPDSGTPPTGTGAGDDSGSTPTAPSEGADIVPPKLIFPTSTLVFDSQSGAGTSVTYTIAAIDDHDGEVTPTCSPASGSRFPIGKVNVVCTATDSSGNKALGSFVVEVRLAQDFVQKADFPEFKLPNSQTTVVIASAVIGVAGIAVYAGVKAAKKTRAKSSQPQKSA